jgi:histidinol-phosphatase (PHP family)
MPPDYHMHTHLCHHAVGVPTDLARRAVELGLTEIGISEHNPMPRDDFDDWRMYQSKLGEYLDAIDAARQAFPQLRILAGLEVDFIPGYESWIQDLAARHDWDYFIGSVHYVEGGWDIDNPKRLGEWQARRAYDVWAQYFERLTAAASSRLFQTIGHADLPKKFCFVPAEDCTSLFDTFLRAAGQNGVAIEINTAGLRKECKEMYPSPTFLRLARRHDVKLTFGSDAHHPGEVAMNFNEALQLARDCGYTETVRFQKRKVSALPLNGVGLAV